MYSYQRIDLAKEQLDVALEIFLSHKSNVSALTLAGAAEEIFGKSLTQRGEKTTLQHEHSIIAPVEKLLQHKPYNWKEFILEKNRVRNAAKHMKDKTESTVIADIEDEALPVGRVATEKTQLICRPSLLLWHSGPSE